MKPPGWKHSWVSSSMREIVVKSWFFCVMALVVVGHIVLIKEQCMYLSRPWVKPFIYTFSYSRWDNCAILCCRMCWFCKMVCCCWPCCGDKGCWDQGIKSASALAMSETVIDLEWTEYCGNHSRYEIHLEEWNEESRTRRYYYITPDTDRRYLCLRNLLPGTYYEIKFLNTSRLCNYQYGRTILCKTEGYSYLGIYDYRIPTCQYARVRSSSINPTPDTLVLRNPAAAVSNDSDEEGAQRSRSHSAQSLSPLRKSPPVDISPSKKPRGDYPNRKPPGDDEAPTENTALLASTRSNSSSSHDDVLLQWYFWKVCTMQKNWLQIWVNYLQRINEDNAELLKMSTAENT